MIQFTITISNTIPYSLVKFLQNFILNKHHTNPNLGLSSEIIRLHFFPNPKIKIFLIWESLIKVIPRHIAFGIAAKKTNKTTRSRLVWEIPNLITHGEFIKIWIQESIKPTWTPIPCHSIWNMKEKEMDSHRMRERG